MGVDVERPEKEFGNPFFQQKMTHYYSNISPHAAIMCLFIVTVVFIPIGAAIIVASDSVYELDVRYDHLLRCTNNNNTGVTSTIVNGTTYSQGCLTNAVFTLDKSLVQPIYIYYRLDPFYQNYRLYAQSMNENQLQGASYSSSDLSNCDPIKTPNREGLLTVGNQNQSYSSMSYSPCGSVAWTMFNDTISLYRTPTAPVPNQPLPADASPICIGNAFDVNGNPTSATNSCVKKGIALSQDVNSRFSARPASTISVWTGEGYSGATSDPYFSNGWYVNEPGHVIPRIYDEDFMVWARISPLSNFRKLYRKITVDLPAGQYSFRIEEHFDAVSIGAEKHLIIATTSWVGGANHVLGALYLTMGSISLILAFGFIGMYLARNK